MSANQFRRTDDQRKRIVEVMIRSEAEDQPDLSFLETEYDEPTQTIIKSCRYGPEAIDEHGWAKVLGWIHEDHSRLADHGAEWQMIGIWVEAKITVNGVTQCLQSGGLWGVESDSDHQFFGATVVEELDELRATLADLGFDAEEVGSANMNEDRYGLDLLPQQLTVTEFGRQHRDPERNASVNLPGEE